MLLDRIEGIVGNGEKVLVFTQFREMGDMLVRFIEERTGQRPMFYHGGCSIKERHEMVDRFQQNRADKVFILSLKAAGTGSYRPAEECHGASFHYQRYFRRTYQ